MLDLTCPLSVHTFLTFCGLSVNTDSAPWVLTRGTQFLCGVEHIKPRLGEAVYLHEGVVVVWLSSPRVAKRVGEKCVGEKRVLWAK